MVLCTYIFDFIFVALYKLKKYSDKTILLFITKYTINVVFYIKKSYCNFTK
jgi:hypothetical protein